MARISTHAKRRAGERLCPQGQAARLLAAMWHTGRVPADADFARFRTWRRANRDYRIATRHGTEFLLVRETAGDRPFITILNLKEDNHDTEQTTRR